MMNRLIAAALLGLLTASCTTPPVVGDHADVKTRMFTIASPFEQGRRHGGMSGVIEAVNQCYASATSPIIEIYALRDCLILDYVGQRIDATVGRKAIGSSLPFFERV